PDGLRGKPGRPSGSVAAAGGTRLNFTADGREEVVKGWRATGSRRQLRSRVRENVAGDRRVGASASG
ncbi:MAG: hypothetical protein ACOYM3_24115, partial [Terrimicrobiaceae bacterium]